MSEPDVKPGLLKFHDGLPHQAIGRGDGAELGRSRHGTLGLDTLVPLLDVLLGVRPTERGRL